MHGYDITTAVERSTKNGSCSPTQETIYPVLHEFEEGGYVSVEAKVVWAASGRSTRSPIADAPHSRSLSRRGWT